MHCLRAARGSSISVVSERLGQASTFLERLGLMASPSGWKRSAARRRSHDLPLGCCCCGAAAALRSVRNAASWPAAKLMLLHSAVLDPLASAELSLTPAAWLRLLPPGVWITSSTIMQSSSLSWSTPPLPVEVVLNPEVGVGYYGVLGFNCQMHFRIKIFKFKINFGNKI